jgi:hypothetical protein
MMKPVELKEVAFGDGQLRFRLPASWVESTDDDGSAAFYDEKLDQGTLRVKLMTFTTEDDLTGHKAVEELEAIEAEPGQTLEALPNGNALRFHREKSQTVGANTTFHVWLLASIDGAHRMRLAVFSFTVADPEAESLPGVMATLDREIRAAHFAHQIS